MKIRLIFLIIIILTLPLMIFISQQIQQLLSRAAEEPANIIIDTQNIIGPLEKSWASFSQGGEEPPPMLTNTVVLMRKLFPKYVRLDHIYDYYNVVKKNENNLSYDFSQLDKTVDDILAMGALPFFCLSYMPSSFTLSGKVIDAPINWNDWKDLVKTTIERYSGKNGKNLNNIYYEVWNEPELPQFGQWKLSSEKDYRLLYFYSSSAAKEAQNVNNFYLGGPSVGSYYPDWIKNLLSYISQNNLRFDFYSWHRYSKNPDSYASDAQEIRKLLSAYPSYANIPLILTEWGIESENMPINSSNTSAAYTVAAISKFHKNINLAFTFEIKDGPPPTGGTWGIITHEKDKEPLKAKPRYKAFTALNNLDGSEIALTGEGTFVKAFGAKTKDGSIKVIIANYDFSNSKIENVPVTFINLPSASYKLGYSHPLDSSMGEYDLTTDNGMIFKSFLMPANSILLLELFKK